MPLAYKNVNLQHMKKLWLIALIGVIRLPVEAQDGCSNDTIAVAPIQSSQLMGCREASPEEKAYAQHLAEMREQEQIDHTLPAIDNNGQVEIDNSFYPTPYWAWNTWPLHKGLNVNLGTSVFANFGGNGHHGAGFTQDVSLMYVTNLSKKATLAVGGYLNNMTYSGDNYTTAGLTAILGYRFDEHWSAYAFIQKAFVSDNVRPTLYHPYWGGYDYYGLGYLGGLGMGYNSWNNRMVDRIGGGVRYEWGNHNSLEINVEFDHVPTNMSHGYDTRHYDYPVR